MQRVIGCSYNFAKSSEKPLLCYRVMLKRSAVVSHRRYIETLIYIMFNVNSLTCVGQLEGLWVSNHDNGSSSLISVSFYLRSELRKVECVKMLAIILLLEASISYLEIFAGIMVRKS